MYGESEVWEEVNRVECVFTLFCHDPSAVVPDDSVDWCLYSAALCHVDRHLSVRPPVRECRCG